MIVPNNQHLLGMGEVGHLTGGDKSGSERVAEIIPTLPSPPPQENKTKTEYWILLETHVK